MKSNTNKKTLGIAFAAILVLALFTACFTGTTSAQISESEPNNEFGDANLIPLDTPITATLYPFDDYDWFKVSISATGVLNISVLNVPSAMCANVELYDANNHRIADTTGAAGATVSFIRDITPGDYYIKIRDSTGGSYTTPYTLTVTLKEVPDEYEPNGDFAHAKKIELGTPITAYIFRTGDYDWYKVNVTKQGILKASVSNVPSDIEACVDIYNKNLDHLSGTCGSAGADVWRTYDVIDPDYYYIRIHDSGDNERALDPYTLNVTLEEVTGVDLYEPNGWFAQASEIELSKSVNAFIYGKGDYDWYRVNVTKQGILKASVSNVPSDIEACVDIYNKNLDHLSGACGSSGADVWRTYDVIDPDYYYIRIHDSGDNERALDSYTLNVTLEEVTGPDLYEPNNDFAHAYLLKTTGTINAYIWRAGDNDWFKGYVGTAGKLTVSVTNVPTTDMRMRIDIYSKHYNHLTGVTGSPGADISCSCDVGEGYHYVRIYETTGRRALVPYTMTTSGVTFVTPPVDTPVTTENEPNNDFGDTNLISLGTPVTGTINPLRDGDWYKVNITNPGILKASLTNVPDNIDMYFALHDANKNRITYEHGSLGADVSISYDVIDPGYYYFAVGDWGNNALATEPYTLNVTFEEVVDPNEPNNDFGWATDIELNKPINGYIFRKGDGDWYMVDIPKTGILKASLTNVPDNIDMYFALHDANKNRITYEHGSLGADVSISYDVIDPGYYYFAVGDWGNNALATEPYTLNVTFEEVVDPNEPNNDFGWATDIELNKPINGYIFRKGDGDWYMVDIPKTGILKASLTNVPDNIDMYFALHDANKNRITYEHGSLGADVSISYDVIDPGYYYFAVGDWANNALATEPYTLNVTFEEVVDPYEPNNAFGDAYWLTAGKLNAYVFRTGDCDWYRGYVEKDTKLTVSVTDVPDNIDMYIAMYDKNNHRLTYKTGALGEDVSISYDADAKGCYYIVVADGWNNARSPDPYTMTVSGMTVPDTMEPSIFNLQPKDGSVVKVNRPQISASYTDIGTGIDITSVKIFVDEKDVTADATVSHSQVTYMPTTSLADGKHNATVSVKDKADNSYSVTWYFTVATKPTVLISVGKERYSPSDTMDITINVLNPTSDTQKANFSLRLNTPAYDYSIFAIPVTLDAGFDETYLIPYTVGNFGASSFKAQWIVALLDPETSEIISSNTAEWTYVPGPGASASVMSYEEIVPEKIAEGIKKAVEKAEIFK